METPVQPVRIPFASVEVPFDKDGTIAPLGPIDADAAAGAADAVRALVDGVDDLIVFSHGWNDNVPDARTLCAGVLGSVSSQWNDAGLTDDDRQRTGVVALFWPAKKFDEADLVAPATAAAAIDDATPDYAAAIAAQIANLKDADGQLDASQHGSLDDALAHVSTLDSEASQNAYVAALARLFPASAEEHDPGLDASKDGLVAHSGAAILADIQTQLGAPVTVAVATGGADSLDDADDSAAAPTGLGEAQGFDPIGDVRRAAQMLLNLTTYYIMKERAGTVGRAGAAPLVIAALQAKPALRVHLVGHSFGGRLVTSLANALPDGMSVSTMTLLQAAYSHYGLAPAPPDGGRPVGAFRDVVANAKVRDVIAITHSRHDWAVGAAYPIASFVARDTASAVPISVPGTANSPWGGMGASGARATDEAIDDVLVEGRTAYAPLPSDKRIRNLAGDAFIGGHGDVCGPQVAWAILQGFVRGRAR